MTQTLRSSWLLLTLVLVIGGGCQIALSRLAMSQANAGMVEAGLRGLSLPLEEAYHSHDDLDLQNLITALAQAPGIHYACITDTRKKVLAHSDPSHIGRFFASPRGQRVKTRPLPDRDGRPVWGHLQVSVSDRFERDMLRWQIGLLILVCLGVLGCFVLGVRRSRRAFHALSNELEELRFRCREISTHAENERGRQENAILRGSLWLQGALERVPDPALLLDEAQRVVVFHPSLRGRLGGTAERTLSGCSWQDLPLLADCGQTLQSSLDQPGQPFETVRDGCRILFLSDASPLGTHTWITFHSSSLS